MCFVSSGPRVKPGDTVRGRSTSPKPQNQRFIVSRPRRKPGEAVNCNRPPRHRPPTDGREWRFTFAGAAPYGFAMNTHLKGILITALGVLIVTPDSLFVRLIDGDPLVTGFWRGLIAGLVVMVVIMAFQGPRAFSVVARSGAPGLIYVVLIASTAPAFALAVTYTSVANVVFILAATPIFAAVYSRIFLGEPIERRMVLTLIAVVIGLGVITYGSNASEIASWKGDLWALYVAAAFAAALTAVRKVRDVSMVPAVPVAYIGAALALLAFTSPFDGFAEKWPLYLAHGALIGAASCLLTLGPRYISSAEVSLLVLLESVLAPLVVWWLLDEDPGGLAITGGVIVIAALVISNYVALRARRS